DFRRKAHVLLEKQFQIPSRITASSLQFPNCEPAMGRLKSANTIRDEFVVPLLLPPPSVQTIASQLSCDPLLQARHSLVDAVLGVQTLLDLPGPCAQHAISIAEEIDRFSHGDSEDWERAMRTKLDPDAPHWATIGVKRDPIISSPDKIQSALRPRHRSPVRDRVKRTAVRTGHLAAAVSRRAVILVRGETDRAFKHPNRIDIWCQLPCRSDKSKRHWLPSRGLGLFSDMHARSR